MKIAVLSFSGGMDSSSLLFNILANSYDKVYCYSFDYGQRHSVEIQKSKELINAIREIGLDVNYQLINVIDAFSDSQSALAADMVLDVPENEYNTENLTATVVENRNVIFSAIIYGKALSLSKKFNATVDIFMGVHSNDYAVYPDCRPESVEMAKELYRISNYGSDKIEYKAPFIDLSKDGVLKEGLAALEKLGLTIDMFKHTSSCYNPSTLDDEVYACGKCATCLDRLKAFERNSVQDPIKYAD